MKRCIIIQGPTNKFYVDENKKCWENHDIIFSTWEDADRSAYNTNDNVLYKAMEKTYAEATSEISQVNPVMQRWLKQTGPNGEHSFGCFWDTTIPFVIYGGKVWNLAGGTLAADFKNAMTQYTAYLIGSEVSSGGASSLQRVKRSGKPATNLSAANATITAIKSGN